MSNRECDGCTACCLTHAILEIKKPTGKLCRHCEVEYGCRIYHKRPKSCREFQCEWLKGLGDDRCRPDRAGVVMDFWIGGPLDKLFQIWEARVGALPSPDSWKATKLVLDQDILVAHMYLSGKKLLFVPDSIILSPKTKTKLLREGLTLTPFPILGL